MTYSQISMFLGIGKATAWLCVHHCTYAICTPMFSVYIRFPTAVEVRKNMRDLQQSNGISRIFGAIDETHFTINKPCEND